MSFDWKGTIGKVAPVLAGLIPGGGVIAAPLVAGLCQLCGLEPSPENAEKAAEQIASGSLTGEQLIKLKQLESDAKAKMAELGFTHETDMARIAAGDLDSARRRNVEMRDSTPMWGFYFTSAGFFGLLTVLIFHAVPDGSRDLLCAMIGALGTAWTMEVKFFYGGGNSDSGMQAMLAELHGMLFRSNPPKE